MSKPKRLTLEYMDLDKLLEMPSNPKAHAVDVIGAAATKYGFNDPPAINETTGRLIEGHGRRKALVAIREAGGPPPPHVVAEGDKWLVPVLRGIAFATDDEAEEYLIAHNEIGRAGGYQEERLAPLLERLKARKVQLESLGLRRSEVAKILAKNREKRQGGAAESSLIDALKAAERWKTALGQVWIIPSKTVNGEAHRLLIGDSMHAEDIDRAVNGLEVKSIITDPPYAIYGSSTGIGSDIADDSMVRPFFESIFATCVRLLPWFGMAHVCCDWRSWAAIWESAKRAGMACRNMIVWDKMAPGMGNNYSMCYEIVGYFVKLPPTGAMKGNKQTGQRQVLRPNMQRFPRPTGDDRMHNAAKPVGLMVEFVQNSTDVGDLVLDPFCGSGTTLVACEQAERICVTLEKAPKFAAVTLERLSLLGLEPKLERSDAK